MNPRDLEKYLEFGEATPKQAEKVRAYAEHGTLRAAGAALGCNPSSIRNAVKAVEAKAAAHGFSPEHGVNSPTPAGYEIKGTSTYTKTDDGGQWVKTEKAKVDELQQFRAAVAGLLDEVTGLADPTPAPRPAAFDLESWYLMGDPHIGLYSWQPETTVDFDLKIAEQELTDATVRLVDSSPASETGVIYNVGDFFHSDNQQNRTSRSGNYLDVDGRWSKVLQVGIRIMRNCISAALARHQTVRVYNAIGNHDDHSAVFLSIALAQYFEREPRVHICTSPAMYYYHEFGRNLVGMTHGHGCKMAALGGVMAADQPEAWGRTRKRYWFTGHFHSDKVVDLPGVRVEQIRTLAAPDAWTVGSGYRSGRDMKSVVLHREFGEVERHTVDISEVQAAA